MKNVLKIYEKVIIINLIGLMIIAVLVSTIELAVTLYNIKIDQ